MFLLENEQGEATYAFQNPITKTLFIEVQHLLLGDCLATLSL